MNTVKVNGIDYVLTSDAQLTNRLIPFGYQDAGGGESYRFEMMAHAERLGAQYRVYWIFDTVKGDEIELDQYNYDVADRVEEVGE